MTWIAIVNPSAGRKRQPIHALEEQASSHSLKVTFVETQSVDEVNDVATGAVADGYVDFVAVGGDGTSNTLVNSLMPLRHAERFSLGVIAAGSGSDLVRTFGHSNDLDEGFRRLVKPDRYPIDVGVITLLDTTTYFLNAANVGVAAESVP
jgi:diacylglycerol kinase family enzyme